MQQYFRRFSPLVLIFLLVSCKPENNSSNNSNNINEDITENNTNNTNNANNTNNSTVEICDDGIDNDNDGKIDCEDLNCMSDPACSSNNNNQDIISDEDGDNNSYEFDTDAGDCPPEMIAECTEPIPSGCLSSEVPNNGLDDNCNGQIDEVGDVSCSPGDVRSCFLGPPNRRGVGACVDGQQTCLQTSSEFGHWGPCEGGISPSAEICDNLDNDCNGCIDDELCCSPPIMCPSSDDPTLQGVQPFTDFVIDGANYYGGTAVKWEWTVSSGPCDNVLGANSYTVNGDSTLGYVATTPQITLNFQLSGEYTVTMKVYYTDTEYYECTFIVHVTGPGLRVELCWDTNSTTDIDLHLMKHGLGSNYCSNEDCYYSNCKAYNWNHSDWSSSDSSIDMCIGTDAGSTWQNNYNACKNPRLDIDNISDGPIPENINIDTPHTGDSYRVAVDFYSGSDVTHPVVNIYCDGVRIATYGYPTPNQVTFTDGSTGCAEGQLWRVADIQTTVDSVTGAVTCNVTSLADSGGNPNMSYGSDSF